MNIESFHTTCSSDKTNSPATHRDAMVETGPHRKFAGVFTQGATTSGSVSRVDIAQFWAAAGPTISNATTARKKGLIQLCQVPRVRRQYAYKIRKAGQSGGCLVSSRCNAQPARLPAPLSVSSKTLRYSVHTARLWWAPSLEWVQSVYTKLRILHSEILKF